MKELFLIMILSTSYLGNYCNAQRVGEGTIKVTTNQRCALKIDNRNFGILKKGETKLIKLLYGDHKLTATNTAGSDQYSEKIKVDVLTNVVNIKLDPPPSPSKGTIKVTTNELCTLKIDNRNFGNLKKGETRSIELGYGPYKLTATNSTSSEQYSENINVSRITSIVDIQFKQPSPPAKGTIKITTDETCTLKIDNQNLGIINKGETKSIDLPLGYHKITASNYRSNEHQYSEDINVRPGTSNVNIKLNQIVLPTRPDSGQVIVKRIVYSLLSNMVSVTADTFIMGDDLGKNDEGPQHSVTIPPILFSKYEVTQQEWQTIMGTNPSKNDGCKQCPVENISWNDIDSFLTKINRTSPYPLRLPTEAEWEYVASKGGDNKDLKQKAWYKDNSANKTHQVGQKSANSLGVYDLFGNVAEWCSDWYGFNYYKNKLMNNPKGPPSGQAKVVRGGSYDSKAGALRPSERDSQNPGSKSGRTGLRLVMDAK